MGCGASKEDDVNADGTSKKAMDQKADILRASNTTFARTEGMNDNESRGKWRKFRLSLVKAKNPQEFAKIADMTGSDMTNALSNFKALDANCDMALDTTEVARAVQLDPADTYVGLIFLMLDLNRDKKVNFREYLIAAYAVGQKEQSSEGKTRFCFSMIDKNNNGIIEYEEMIMYFSMAGMGGKKISAREQAAEELRQRAKIEEIMKEMGWDEEKLKVNGVDEDAFVEMASTYSKHFRVMYELYGKLRTLLLGACQKTNSTVEADIGELDEYMDTEAHNIVPWPENTREGSAPRKAKQSGSSKGKSKKSGKEKKKEAEGEDADAGGKKKKKSKTLTNKLVGDGLGETKIGADTDASETDSDGGIVSSAPGEDEIKVPVAGGGGRRGMPRRSVSEAPGKGPMSEVPDGPSRRNSMAGYTPQKAKAASSFGITPAQRRRSMV